MGWRLSDGTAALFIYLNMIKYIARLETTPEEGTTRFLTLTAGVFPMSLNRYVRFSRWSSRAWRGCLFNFIDHQVRSFVYLKRLRHDIGLLTGAKQSSKQYHETSYAHACGNDGNVIGLVLPSKRLLPIYFFVSAVLFISWFRLSD
jgi:hypothetical protein